jgi:hypothetical protein
MYKVNSFLCPMLYGKSSSSCSFGVCLICFVPILFLVVGDFFNHWCGNEASLEGALFGFLQAPPYLWPSFRSKLLQGDLGPLRHEFRTINAYQKASNVNIFLCDSTTTKFMAQGVEWIHSI